MQLLQVLLQFAFAAFGRLLDLIAAFLQFQADGDAGGVFLAQFVAEAGEVIDPGLDAVLVRALLGHTERALPGIVALVAHGHAVPMVFAQAPPTDQDGQLVMAIGEHVACNLDTLALHGLDRKGPGVDHRCGVFNGDPGQQQSLGQR